MITRFAHTAASLTLENGATFGLLPGTNQVVTGIKGWHGSAGVRGAETEKLWQHGTFAERSYKTNRVITLQGHIETDTRAEAAALTDSLAAILGDGTIGTFTVTDADQGTRWAPVKLAGAVEVVWDGENEIDVTVDMTSHEARKFGQEETYTTGTSSPTGGLVNDPVLMEDGVIDFGDDVGSNGTITVINAGTAPVPLVFEVAGEFPATGFTITEVGTGRRLRYATTQQPGEFIVLDAYDGTVMLNGVVDRSDFLVERGWPVLQPGPNTFLFEAVNSGAILTARAASAWW